FVLGLVSFTFGLVSGIASGIGNFDPSARAKQEVDGYIYAGKPSTRVLAVLRGSQSRIIVPSAQISGRMKQAIVAVGQALLRAPRRRRARDRPRRLAGPPQREGRRGRLDDHAAVRQEHLREPPALDRPEAEGGGDRLAARAALVEGPDPDRLPEHDLFREWRLWRRTGLTDLLPPQGRPDDLGRGGAPCRDPERPLAVRPGGRPEGGAGAAGHRPT